MTHKNNTTESKNMLPTRFLDRISDSAKYSGKKFCFILGAGASRSSGIRPGEEMMREWFQYLWNQKAGRGKIYIQECACDLDPKHGLETYARFFDENYVPVNEDYFDVYDLRFAGQPEDGFSILEKEMEGKFPSCGYYPLAHLLASTCHNVVITTNFDSLVEDSLRTFFPSKKHAQVIAHENLARYIRADAQRPIVAKIHRALFFEPLNRKEDMEMLAKEWRTPLQSIFAQYIPIVVGYAGGDNTLMSLLDGEDNTAPLLPNGIFWCHLANAKPPEKVRKVVAKHGGYLVPIDGFDELMFAITERLLDVPMQDGERLLDEQIETLKITYRKSFNSLSRTLGETENKEKKVPPREQEKPESSADAVKRFLTRTMQDTDASDAARANALFRLAVSAYHSNDYEAAISYVDQAILIQPDNAEYYNGRGAALRELGRFEEALDEKNKSITLAPTTARYYDSRGVTYHEMGHYEEALRDKDSAVELSPKNAKYYNSRSVTYHMMGDHAHALADLNIAVELAPNVPDYYLNRGNALRALGRQEEALENFNEAIQLDPENAKYYNSRVIVLDEMGRHTEALEDEKRAIELGLSFG